MGGDTDTLMGLAVKITAKNAVRKISSYDRKL
jgi:tRNA A37 threonylcarbamoyladenosine synthetase subunit TsaC/SUA5/YrdC